MRLTHLIFGGVAAALLSAPQATAASASTDSIDAFVPAIEFAMDTQDPVDKPKTDKPKTGDKPKKRGKKGDRPKKGERKKKKGGGDKPPHKRGKKGDRPGGTKDPERPDRP